MEGKTEVKKCYTCCVVKPIIEFHKHSYSKDGFDSSCRDCVNKKTRERRKKQFNASTHKYERTVNGFLMRTYRNMKSRVTGVQKRKKHLYFGLDLLDKNEFYNWSKSSEDFFRLYNNWVNSGYNIKFCPSIDRIDSGIGYVLSNMQWITHSENSKKGSLSRFNKLHDA